MLDYTIQIPIQTEAYFCYQLMEKDNRSITFRGGSLNEIQIQTHLKQTLRDFERELLNI